MPLAENIQYYDLRIVGTFAASQNGKLVYLNESQNNLSTVILDKNGKEIKKLLDQKPMYFIQFSQDGTKLAYDVYDQNEKNIDVWTYDITRNVTTRFTFSKYPDFVPIFTKDGKKIIYTTSTSGGINNSYIKNSDGSGEAKLLATFNSPSAAFDVSPDGNLILYMSLNWTGNSNSSGWDILLLNLNKDKKPVGLLTKNYNEVDCISIKRIRKGPGIYNPV